MAAGFSSVAGPFLGFRNTDGVSRPPISPGRIAAASAAVAGALATLVFCNGAAASVATVAAAAAGVTHDAGPQAGAVWQAGPLAASATGPNP